MQKAILLANKIRQNLDKDYKTELEDSNLYYVFESIFEMKCSPPSANALICAIIYSYDNESTWIDLRQDAGTINTHILKGLKRNVTEPLMIQFIEGTNENILVAIGKYLDQITDWKFITVRMQIDFHMQVMNMKQPKVSVDEKGIEDEEGRAKALESRGKSINEAIRQRKAADEFIKEIQAEYVKTDHRTKEEFGKGYTEQEIFTKVNINSWEDFIRYTVIPAREAKLIA